MRPDPYFERCTCCEVQLHYMQYILTKDHLGLSLCSPCEKNFRSKRIRATPEEVALFVALRHARIPATLQHHDGFKTVDIFLQELNVNIEVDGGHHRYPGQALKDLQRCVYSLQENISTLRIPNRLVNDRIAETVKSIRHLYDVKKKKTGGKPGSLL